VVEFFPVKASGSGGGGVVWCGVCGCER
jgi:hypothetical protein